MVVFAAGSSSLDTWLDCMSSSGRMFRECRKIVSLLFPKQNLIRMGRSEVRRVRRNVLGLPENSEPNVCLPPAGTHIIRAYMLITISGYLTLTESQGNLSQSRSDFRGAARQRSQRTTASALALVSMH